MLVCEKEKLEKKYQFGKKELIWGKNLVEMTDATELLEDPQALREHLNEQGYLLLRGFHKRADVLEARQEILEFLDSKGVIEKNTNLDDAIFINKPSYLTFEQNDIQTFHKYLNIVNSQKLMNLVSTIRNGGQPLTFDYKWLRAVPPAVNTGCHYDIVYMGNGTKELLTCWTPLGDISKEQGTLTVCHNSHKLTKVKNTYGKTDVDRDLTEGWLTQNPIEFIEKHGGKWATTDFKAGDIVLFGMYFMHGSLNNTTKKHRLSSDTRYQLENEDYDKRWYGKNFSGHYASNKLERKSMEPLKAKWGI